jgi:hypothetical protein
MQGYYNPSPYRAQVDFAKTMGTEPPPAPIFRDGNSDSVCSVCKTNTAHTKGFGQCPACFYINFNYRVEDFDAYLEPEIDF